MVVRRREADDWWFLVDANSGGSLRGFGFGDRRGSCDMVVEG